MTTLENKIKNNNYTRKVFLSLGLPNELQTI